MSAPTLVDCGCEARVHADGSGIEIDYCPLHDSASVLLAVAEAIEDHIKRGALQTEGHALRRRLQAAIASAKGSYT
jgi:hypothetical protein